MARNICLVGAGYISDVHAAAIKTIPGLTLQSVVDPNPAAAASLAKTHRIPAVYRSIDEAIAAGNIGAAHVLTPPDRHAETAMPFLRAGIAVLLEKPLAVSTPQCDALIAAARETGTRLGVNQNFVHHPAFVRLRRALAEGRLGQPRYADCIYHAPLRQMASRQFGHWMFLEPGNILLEQAVHPLSQLEALAGAFEDFQVTAGSPREISPGVPFYDSVCMILRGRRFPSALRMAVAQEFPFWQVTVVCDDGVAVADILNNRFFTYGRTRWLEAADQALSGLKTAWSIGRDSTANLLNYALSTVKLRGRSDSFFLSMKGSIAAFHEALDRNTTPELDGAFGAELVCVCESAAAQAFSVAHAPKRPKEEGTYDIAIIGGTGFIGSHLVQRLAVDQGLRVGVMARNVRNLAPALIHPNVTVVRGDVRRKDDVARFIANSSVVIGLAHGGGGKSYAEIRDGMVGGAETIARTCLLHGVKRFIHVGSIASLYLGPQQGAVTGSTPPDPQSDSRADYARAKAECDRMLLAMHRDESLPVCILRPGLVVGEGTSPFHSGLGFYNNEQHCMGWNAGRNPLPFVLVEDVAQAIVAAVMAPEIEGKCFNIVGDVKPSAREYTAELARALGRPLRFHPHSATNLWLVELGKWLLKRLGGRVVPVPSKRDLLSRGLMATFDCRDAKAALGWSPVSDREVFLDRAIRVHQRP
jgi:predicted dehydrogenase/nucleoside-diphosphate-sugar epimerase